MAQVQFRALHAQFYGLQQECTWLGHVIVAEQHLVEQLLPYYPHPLTAPMLHAVELYQRRAQPCGPSGLAASPTVLIQ